jgi:ABC-type uncharacterized transport system ATPase subunit
VVGENGAGKRRYEDMRVLSAPDSGQNTVRGRRWNSRNQRGHEIGIGMVHQLFMTIRALNERKNILFGANRERSSPAGQESRMRQRSDCAAGYGFPWIVRWNAESSPSGSGSRWKGNPKASPKKL